MYLILYNLQSIINNFSSDLENTDTLYEQNNAKVICPQKLTLLVNSYKPYVYMKYFTAAHAKLIFVCLQTFSTHSLN